MVVINIQRRPYGHWSHSPWLQNYEGIHPGMCDKKEVTDHTRTAAHLSSAQSLVESRSGY